MDAKANLRQCTFKLSKASPANSRLEKYERAESESIKSSWNVWATSIIKNAFFTRKLHLPIFLASDYLEYRKSSITYKYIDFIIFLNAFRKMLLLLLLRWISKIKFKRHYRSNIIPYCEHEITSRYCESRYWEKKRPKFWNRWRCGTAQIITITVAWKKGSR